MNKYVVNYLFLYYAEMGNIMRNGLWKFPSYSQVIPKWFSSDSQVSLFKLFGKLKYNEHLRVGKCVSLAMPFIEL